MYRVFISIFLNNEYCKWERAIYFIHSRVIAYDVIVTAFSSQYFSIHIYIL